MQKVVSIYNEADLLFRKETHESLHSAENSFRTLIPQIKKLDKEQSEVREAMIFEESLSHLNSVRENEEVNVMLIRIQHNIRYMAIEQKEKNSLLKAVDLILKKNSEKVPLSSIQKDIEAVQEMIKKLLTESETKTTTLNRKETSFSNNTKSTLFEIYVIHDLMKNLDSDVKKHIDPLAIKFLKNIRQIESQKNIETEYYYNIVSKIRRNIQLLISKAKDAHTIFQQKIKQFERMIIEPLSKLDLILSSPLTNVDDLKNNANELKAQLESLNKNKNVKSMFSELQQISSRIDNLYKQFHIVSQQETERTYILNTVQNVLFEMGYDVIDAPYQEKANYKAPVMSTYSTPYGEGMQLSLSSDGTTFIQLKRLSDDNEGANTLDEFRKIEANVCNDYTNLIQKVEEFGVNIFENERRFNHDISKIPVLLTSDVKNKKRKKCQFVEKKLSIHTQ